MGVVLLLFTSTRKVPFLLRGKFLARCCSIKWPSCSCVVSHNFFFNSSDLLKSPSVVSLLLLSRALVPLVAPHLASPPLPQAPLLSLLLRSLVLPLVPISTSPPKRPPLVHPLIPIPTSPRKPLPLLSPRLTPDAPAIPRRAPRTATCWSWRGACMSTRS